MPRYFFNVHDGIDVPDREGTELPDTKAVRDMAVRSAGEAIKDMGQKFWSHEEWRLDVVDEQENHVLTLRFSGQTA